MATEPKPIWHTYLIFVAPMVLSSILQALSGTLNNIYLGNMIGVKALAAVSVFFPIMFLFVAFVMGLSSGTIVLIGQAHGAGLRERVKTIAGTAFAIAMFLGAAIAVFGVVFVRPLMELMATPPDILADATLYARLMMMSMVVLFPFLVSASIIRGVGDSVTPLIAFTIFTSMGLIITPALIAGWFGLPPIGVASAAVASLVSAAATLLLLGLYLRARAHPMSPDAAFWRGMRLEPKLSGTIARLGLPSAVQIAAMALAELVLLGLINRYGVEATAAYGAVNQVISYVQFPAISIAITASIFAAQAIGRAQSDRLHAIVQAGMMLSFCFTGALTVLVLLLSRDIISLFVTDPQVIDLARQQLNVVLWSAIVFGLSGVLTAVMRASGTVFAPMGLSITAIAVIGVPSAILLRNSYGIAGVWMAYPIIFFSMLLLQATYYALIWRRRSIARLV